MYVHVEVQGSHDADFAKRVFVYNYRLFDRYDRPVASLAVLADDDTEWRPNHFRTEVFGCETGIRFPVTKLTDHAARLDTLLVDTNPFALVTAAHLLTRQTRRDPAARFQAKRQLVASSPAASALSRRASSTGLPVPTRKSLKPGPTG